MSAFCISVIRSSGGIVICRPSMHLTEDEERESLRQEETGLELLLFGQLHPDYGVTEEDLETLHAMCKDRRTAQTVSQALDLAFRLGQKVKPQEVVEQAPACDVCGTITIRNGTTYKCHNCGNSMGCT